MRGKRLQSHPCETQPAISEETWKRRYVPSATGHYASAERVCWNSAEAGGQRDSRENEKTVTHHIRIGTKVPPPVSNGEATFLLMDSILKRTDFAVPRQCTAQIGNAFSIEPSVNDKQKKGVQHILDCPGISLRTRSMVRSAIRVPSYSAAKANDEYRIKTTDSRYPRTMSVSLWLLRVSECR